MLCVYHKFSSLKRKIKNKRRQDIQREKKTIKYWNTDRIGIC